MSPTSKIDELEALLNSEEETPIQILPNGEIREIGRETSADIGNKKPLTMHKEVSERRCQNRRQGEASVEVHVSETMWGKLSGIGIQPLIIMLFVLILFGGLWWQAVDNTRENREQFVVLQRQLAVITIAQAENVKLNIGRQDALKSAITTQTSILSYILSKDQKERDKLNLTMPDELKYGQRK